MPVPVIVLNFGHSVLNSLEDYTQAASEIYRHYRQGQNVVAVMSAQGDQTDVLMAEARRIGPEGDAKNLPELLQLGERRSAALLALALERVGAPAFVRQARDLGLTAEGSFTEARLTGLNTPQLLQDLKDHDIVVMPGFVAIGEKDRAVLLGDGGADLTALYVADQLGVEAVLLKDVDGIYDVDPKSNPDSARYEEISWDDAIRVAGPLIAPRALGFARKQEVPFRVGMPGLPSYTRVGAKTGTMKQAPNPKKLRIAMMGLGVVGGGVYRRVEAHPDLFEIVKIKVRNPGKYIDQGFKPELLSTEFSELTAAKPDIFIDVSGGIEPALSYCKEMLENGVHVVSANKQAIAAGGQELLDFAAAQGAQLCFSSAAGGGMPVLEMCLREKGRITRVRALLNGTTNYMLDEIGKGRSYSEALKDAQDKGFAEADPTADVGGADAGAKIRLIAMLGFGEVLALKDIPLDSIENFNPESPAKGAWKRISTLWKDQNGFSTAYRIRGKGAGRWPTTESVMADLFDVSETTLT